MLAGEGGGAGAQLADAPVARARALGVHEQVPALMDEAVDVVGRPVAEAAAAALDRHGVEHERDERRRRALLVEVVGRRRDRRALAPLARQRAQDHRRVEVAGVVGDEDHRRLEPLEALGAVRPHAHVVADHRAQHAAEDRLAHVPRGPAARPRHVQARHALPGRGALVGDAAAEVATARGCRARRGARARCSGASTVAHGRIDPTVPHASSTPSGRGGFAAEATAYETVSLPSMPAAR